MSATRDQHTSANAKVAPPEYLSLRAMMQAMRAQDAWARHTGEHIALAGVDRRALSRRLFARFRAEITDEAINGLYRRRPDESAKRLMTRAQAVLFTLALAALCIAVATAPAATLICVNALAAAYFLGAVYFRLHLMILSRRDGVGASAVTPMRDESLPVITILLPLYRDGAALPALAQAIDALDYPAALKDVKLLLEADDAQTRDAAAALGLDRRYDVIVAPPEGPRTKPKACNYGLQLARGELVVIYDAEDIPEPDQLRKAAAAFARSDERLACMQARLNFYNSADNWLTHGIVAHMTERKNCGELYFA